MKLDNIQARIALNSIYGIQPKYPRGYGGSHITNLITEKAKIEISKKFVCKMDDDIFRTPISYLVSHEYINSYNFFKIIYQKLVTNRCWEIINEMYRRQYNGR